MFNSRVQLRHHCSYSGKKKSFRVVRTPGKKLTIIYRKKKRGYIKCSDTKKRINGIQNFAHSKVMSLSKRKKTVSRIYGGCLSGNSLRKRIVKAFLIEEQNVVKKVLKIHSNKNV